MSCPKCKSGQTVSLWSMKTPEGSYPMQCIKCMHTWDEAVREPGRAWRFNYVGKGQFRLVEVVDGHLCAIGLSVQVGDPNASEEYWGEGDAYGLAKADAKARLTVALAGMLYALNRPVVYFDQVMREEEAV